MTNFPWIVSGKIFKGHAISFLRDGELNNFFFIFFIDLHLRNKESVYHSRKKQVGFLSINNNFVRVEGASYKVGEKKVINS